MTLDKINLLAINIDKSVSREMLFLICYSTQMLIKFLNFLLCLIEVSACFCFFANLAMLACVILYLLYFVVVIKVLLILSY